MGTSVADVNEKRRERARERGEQTYRHEVRDDWPACTVCGTTIRHRDEGPYRSCSCVGVQWRCLMGGWEKV